MKDLPVVFFTLVEQFEEVSDSVCVGQRNKAGEERVVLFLKLNKDVELTHELTRRLAQTIRAQLSARHVPSVMLPISDIPVSMKLAYIARLFYSIFQIFCFVILKF